LPAGWQVEVFTIPGNAFIVLFKFFQTSRYSDLFNVLIAIEIFSMLPVERSTFIIVIKDDLPVAVKGYNFFHA